MTLISLHRDKVLLHHERGFSLLEMLVVLAILGLLLSLISVRLVSSLESTQFAKTADAAIADIKLFRVEAMLDKQPMRIIASENPPVERGVRSVSLNLPEGWTVTGNDINISKTGFCSGGQITLVSPYGRQASFALTAPKCEAQRIPALEADQHEQVSDR